MYNHEPIEFQNISVRKLAFAAFESGIPGSWKKQNARLFSGVIYGSQSE